MRIIFTVLFLMSSAMAFACQQVDYLDQMERNKNYKNHLAGIQSRLRAKCEIMIERNGNDYEESLHIDFQRSDMNLSRGVIRRAFTANYMCEASDRSQFLKPIQGFVTIYFTPGAINTSCEGIVLKEVYKVHITK